MTPTATAKRLLPLALATVLGVAVFAGAASGHAQAVVFVGGADRVVQGNPVTMDVYHKGGGDVPAWFLCAD